VSIWNEAKTVFAEEVRRGSSRLWYRVVTLAVPVLLVVLLVALPLVRAVFLDDDDAESDLDQSKTGLVDFSDVLSLEQVEDADIRSYPDREAGIDALVDDEITALFIVPTDYLASGKVEWLHTQSSISADFSGDAATDAIERLLREAVIAEDLSDEVKERFLARPTFITGSVQPDGTVEPGAREASFLSISYIFAFILVFSILTGGGFLLESVSEEKQSRMVEIILTSVSPLGMMTGKVLGHGTLALVQVALWIGSLVLVGPRIFDQVPDLGELPIGPVDVLWLVLIFIAGYFVVAVLMSALGAVTNSYKESSQISAIVTLPVILPLVFFQLITGNPDGTLARVLSFIPITAPMTIVLRLGETDLPLIEVLASLSVTVLGGVVLLWLSARIFRAGILMYGQRMTLRGAFKALRQAS